jgi:hypothetical protein
MPRGERDGGAHSDAALTAAMGNVLCALAAWLERLTQTLRTQHLPRYMALAKRDAVLPQADVSFARRVVGLNSPQRHPNL